MITKSAGKLGIIAWCFYDWANSSFATIITTFIFATYFTKAVAPNPILGTHLWGNAVALASLIIALASPLCGAIADQLGRRKPWLAILTAVTILSTALLWFVKPIPTAVHFALICFVLGTITMELGTVFYNAMLRDIAPPGYLGRISGWGWGMGYLGGLICLVIALYGFVQNDISWLNKQESENIRICSVLAAAWLLVFALPLFLLTPDRVGTKLPISLAIKQGLLALKNTFVKARQYKDLMRFIIAQMIYMDGLNTVFAFGGIYAAGTFNMSFDEIVKFGIMLNVTAGLGAISFAWIDDWIGPKKTILIGLFFMCVLTSILLFIHSVKWFWILTLVLALFFGPVQAASRTFMAKIAPVELATEMFGFYALSGKITSFLGPFLFGLLTSLYHTQRAGMAVVVAFWLVGGAILLFLPKTGG